MYFAVSLKKRPTALWHGRIGTPWYTLRAHLARIERRLNVADVVHDEADLDQLAAGSVTEEYVERSTTTGRCTAPAGR